MRLLKAVVLGASLWGLPLFVAGEGKEDESVDVTVEDEDEEEEKKKKEEEQKKKDKKKPQHKFQSIVDQFDKDKNGKIDPYEIFQGMDQKNSGITPEMQKKFRRAFKISDRNKDGGVDAEEWENFYTLINGKELAKALDPEAIARKQKELDDKKKKEQEEEL
eukprot:TRINITY_DN98027_c0_g1_i1.p1 TRINITY_DN98027_c0_g1~~TRINITY_DN98027_c0_g1_i1.p1  ORF type:complete len:162 (+),score=58.55 TRINITY_DN98027_c0_g1_i1:82-567(+)